MLSTRVLDDAIKNTASRLEPERRLLSERVSLGQLAGTPEFLQRHFSEQLLSSLP